jgi:hypothetical protein
MDILLASASALDHLKCYGDAYFCECKATTPKTRPRGSAVFAALAQRAGWKITRAIERPFSDQVVLT